MCKRVLFFFCFELISCKSRERERLDEIEGTGENVEEDLRKRS